MMIVQWWLCLMREWKRQDNPLWVTVPSHLLTVYTPLYIHTILYTHPLLLQGEAMSCIANTECQCQIYIYQTRSRAPTSCFAPFGRSGRKIHAGNWKALKNLVVLTPCGSLERGPDPSPPPFVHSPVGKLNFRSIFYVVVDAIGLGTDFTLETNRKRVKEKLLKST